jgi:hypothetical protein
MTILRFTALVNAQLTLQYGITSPPMKALYDRAITEQWNPDTAVDWKIEVDFGSRLPASSNFSYRSFLQSPMAPYGRPMWDTFRWEFQAWLISQFLHGEQGALLAAARLVETAPELDSKYCAASQVTDEARHTDVFSRYLRDNIPEPYPISSGLESLLLDTLADSRWDIVMLGMHLVIEAIALATFRLANDVFHDELARAIVRLVARDEARHLSYGVLSLDGFYAQLSPPELRDREDFVLEAAQLMGRRFLLEDIWERLGIDQGEGREFAKGSELMVLFRQAIFAKVVTSLRRVGLLTPDVRSGLAKQGLVSATARLR